jgi:magnesium transporter
MQVQSHTTHAHKTVVGVSPSLRQQRRKRRQGRRASHHRSNSSHHASSGLSLKPVQVCGGSFGCAHRRQSSPYGRFAPCRTESEASSTSGSTNNSEGGPDDVLLKELFHQAIASRQNLHKRAASNITRALTSISDYAEDSRVEDNNSSSTSQSSINPLDFTHDNDYNAINFEQGTQTVVTGSLVYEVLTMDWKGATFRAYLKRRDLLRHYDLQPRDLRRIDPALADPSPCLSVRDNAILISLGGMRGIISANKAIIFEPDSPYTRKFIEIVSPRIAATSGTTNLEEAGNQLGNMGKAKRTGSSSSVISSASSSSSSSSPLAGEEPRTAASGSNSSSSNVGASASSIQQQTQESLAKYRQQSEDKNLPFELECCEGALMVLVGQLDNELDIIESRIGKLLNKLPAQVNTENLEELRKVKGILVELESKSEQATELLADFLEDEDDIAGMNLTSQLMKEEEQAMKIKKKSKQRKTRKSGKSDTNASRIGDTYMGDKQIGSEFVTIAVDDSEIENILEEAEEELEEVEDLIEYYLQRSTSIFSEVETLLQGMRDMEESISVVLSSRRFEVNRLELALSMGSFAASLGAMISGIFGMNMRNKFEMSVAGFYGTTCGILVLCFAVFFFLYKYTKHRKIL